MATGGLYGQSSAGIVSPQSGSESSGLYGNNTVFGGTYFEWFIFQVSDVQPDTPTGGSWSFTTNSGTPPTGWLATPPANPTNTVWVSVGIVNSKSTTPIVWSTPGKFSFASGLPILSGASAPVSGDGQSDQLYIETGTTPETIWFKQAGTWTRLTGSSLYMDLTSNQTIAGTKTFSSEIQGSVSGTSSNVSGIVDITHGGTGSTTASAARAALGVTATGQDTTYAYRANNLSDLASASTSRTNLGLGTAAVLTAGAANGVATLDSGGTVPLSQIPASIQGGVSYQGAWNASTNSPTLTSSVGSKGYYYVVSTAGSTNLNGVTDWNIGDWAIFNGTVWQKIDNTDAVTSVNGYTGTVVLNASDVGALASITSTDGSITVSQVGTAVDLAVSAASPASTLLLQVRNNSGATMTKGTVVYVNGAVGQLPTIAKALATSDATSAQTQGLVTADISNNSNGYVTIIGLVTGLDTSAYSDGEQLYLSGVTAGAMTATKQYAPIHLVYVGVVTHAHPTQGKIQVKVQNGYELDELHNVSAQTPSNGQTIVYNSSTGLWANNTVSLTAGVNGTLPITSGGTGQTTANAAFNSLAPSQTGNSGKYLTTDGSNTSWATNPLGTVTSVGGTGTVSGITLSGTVTTSGNLTLGGSLDLSSPPAIGSATPSTGAFTTLTTTSTINGLTVGKGAGAVATNTVIGYQAQNATATLGSTTAVGYQAAYSNTGGEGLTYIGRWAGYSTTTGSNNTSTGVNSLFSNTTGANNTSNGHSALFSNTTASNNTAVGYQAGYSNTTGAGIVAVGRLAMYSNTTGVANNALGNAALYTNSTGTSNNGFGQSALYANSTGNYNSAFGHEALTSNTTASYNTAVGYQAGYSNTTGTDLTVVGYGALYSNTTGTYNTALGRTALYSNTTGGANTAVGRSALENNTTGGNNTALGMFALVSNTTASYNTAIGYQSGYSNTTGAENQSFGHTALYYNTTGSYNNAFGRGALYNNTTGNYNVAVGVQALVLNTTASSNTALGYQAAYANTTAEYGTYIGYRAGYSNTTGTLNTAMGAAALSSNTTGNYNVAIGFTALNSNTTASYNTAVGYQSLYSNTTATANTAVGYQASYSNTTGSFIDSFGYGTLSSNTTGNGNSAFGRAVLSANTTGSENAAFGAGYGVYAALRFNTTGSYNAAFGAGALAFNTTASSNGAFGYQALYSNTTGTLNNAFGQYALYGNTTGSYNSAFGHNALGQNSTAQQNTALGWAAGYATTTSGYNVFVGYQSGFATTGGANTFVGSSYAGGAGSAITSGAYNTIIGGYTGNQGGLDIRTASNYIVLSDGAGNPRIWNDGTNTVLNNGGGRYTILNFYNNGTYKAQMYWDNTGGATYVVSGANGVYLANNATSWTSVSDETRKVIIEPITDAANKVSTLRTVIGRLKSDDETVRRPYLIAQDVQAVLPEAVIQSQDKEGAVLGLSYTEVIPLLVAAIKELKAEIDTLKGN